MMCQSDTGFIGSMATMCGGRGMSLSKKTAAGRRNRNMIAKALRQERQAMSFPFK